MREKQVINIPAKELIPIMEQELKEGKAVSFSPKGVSMLPLIREGKDSVTLKRAGEIKNYDIALYKRQNGQYVLHRAIIKKGKLLFIGDNQYVYEQGIGKEQIIAVVSNINRAGKNIKAESFLYKTYCVFWQKSRGIRYFIYRVIRKIRSMVNGK